MSQRSSSSDAVLERHDAMAQLEPVTEPVSKRGRSEGTVHIDGVQTVDSEDAPWEEPGLHKPSESLREFLYSIVPNQRIQAYPDYLTITTDLEARSVDMGVELDGMCYRTADDVREAMRGSKTEHYTGEVEDEWYQIGMWVLTNGRRGLEREWFFVSPKVWAQLTDEHRILVAHKEAAKEHHKVWSKDQEKKWYERRRYWSWRRQVAQSARLHSEERFDVLERARRFERVHSVHGDEAQKLNEEIRSLWWLKRDEESQMAYYTERLNLDRHSPNSPPIPEATREEMMKRRAAEREIAIAHSEIARMEMAEAGESDDSTKVRW